MEGKVIHTLIPFISSPGTLIQTSGKLGIGVHTDSPELMGTGLTCRIVRGWWSDCAWSSQYGIEHVC